MFNRLKHDAEDIVKSCIRLSHWYHGCSYDEMLLKSYGERYLIDEFVSERLKEISKMPNLLSLM